MKLFVIPALLPSKGPCRSGLVGTVVRECARQKLLLPQLPVAISALSHSTSLNTLMAYWAVTKHESDSGHKGHAQITRLNVRFPFPAQIQSFRLDGPNGWW